MKSFANSKPKASFWDNPEVSMHENVAAGDTSALAGAAMKAASESELALPVGVKIPRYLVQRIMEEAILMVLVDMRRRGLDYATDPLCIDEGCPHHGTEHVCLSTSASVKKLSVGVGTPVATVTESDTENGVCLVTVAPGGTLAVGTELYLQSGSAAPVSNTLPSQWRDKLHEFLNIAAGEGYKLGGVAADDLYCEIFPEDYAKAAEEISRTLGSAAAESTEYTSKDFPHRCLPMARHLLSVLASRRRGLSLNELHEYARQVDPKYRKRNLVGLMTIHRNKYGTTSSPSPGQYQITDKGRSYLAYLALKGAKTKRTK